MKPILIYSPTITERLRYILDFLWKSDYELTDSLEFFKKHNGPKISYANERTDEQSCWIKPGPLLLEEKIGQQKMEVSYWHDLPIFFQEDGDLPFDIFAACFYLVSRYEEYLPYEKDRYGRLWQQTHWHSRKNSCMYLWLTFGSGNGKPYCKNSFQTTCPPFLHSGIRLHLTWMFLLLFCTNRFTCRSRHWQKTYGKPTSRYYSNR